MSFFAYRSKGGCSGLGNWCACLYGKLDNGITMHDRRLTGLMFLEGANDRYCEVVKHLPPTSHHDPPTSDIPPWPPTSDIPPRAEHCGYFVCRCNFHLHSTMQSINTVCRSKRWLQWPWNHGVHFPSPVAL